MRLNPEMHGVLVPPIPILVKLLLHCLPLIMGNFVLISYTHNTTSIISLYLYTYIWKYQLIKDKYEVFLSCTHLVYELISLLCLVFTHWWSCAFCKVPQSSHFFWLYQPLFLLAGLCKLCLNSRLVLPFCTQMHLLLFILIHMINPGFARFDPSLQYDLFWWAVRFNTSSSTATPPGYYSWIRFR